jgi:hypothetical protein
MLTASPKFAWIATISKPTGEHDALGLKWGSDVAM